MKKIHGLSHLKFDVELEKSYRIYSPKLLQVEATTLAL